MNNEDERIEKQRRHFNKITDKYVSGRKEKNHMTIKDLIWQTAIGSFDFEINGSIYVIEPMCGMADGLELVKRYITNQLNYDGFDYSDEIIALVKDKLPNNNIWRANVTTVDLPSQYYDIAIILGGLHHVPHCTREILKKMYNTLKPGGYFINFEPTNGNFIFKKIREYIYKRNSLFDAETERDFSVGELKILCRDAGFHEMKTTYPGLIAYILYYNPNAFPYLNFGSEGIVRTIFNLEKALMHTYIGRFFSFATFSIWKRPTGS